MKQPMSRKRWTAYRETYMLNIGISTCNCQPYTINEAD